MPSTPIAQMEPNQLVEGVFMIQNCQLGQTRGGKPYIKCLLADKSGRAPGRMWNANEAIFNALPTDGFVSLEGQTQPYQGELQIIIQSIMPVEPTHEQLAELIPSTEQDIDEMFDDVKQTLEGFLDPGLKAIAKTYLEDEELMNHFKQAPAAQNIHHAYLGGLLEHTCQLIRIAKAIMPLYPEVNDEIVIMGLFLHDIAKTKELSWKEGFAYTTEGMMIGHIAIGMLWLRDKIEETRETGVNVSPMLETTLQNIILSHHGEPEFGAIKPPMTPEAVLVSQIDNLDAKAHVAISAVSEARSSMGGEFTEKIFALGTRLFKNDPAG